MPVLNETIRARIDSWSSEQQLYTQQLGESLAALEAYQQHLDEWQQQLEDETRLVVERQMSLERERRGLCQEQADDAALAAELEQARAEIETLRAQFLHSDVDRGTEPTSQAGSPSTESDSRATSDRLERGMNSVAKQFQKLRNQQVARRSAQSQREGGSGHGPS